MNTINNREVLKNVNLVLNALNDLRLYRFSCIVHENHSHELYPFLNNYPPLPFEITQEDLDQIKFLLNLPEANLEAREWTPLEKIFFANLWNKIR